MADEEGVEQVIAFKGEMQLAGWSERHNAGRVVSFWLADDESLEPFKAATARKGRIAGQRYMAVLVEIDDGEVPVVQKHEKSPYGEFARALKLSVFFHQKVVWYALGDPADYHIWLRDQKCAAAKISSCSGQVMGAHRRTAENAGFATKPEFSELPLCNGHHSAQHQHGSSVIADEEWWKRQSENAVAEWAWARLKNLMGYASMAHVPPEKVVAWAKENEVFPMLPDKFRAL